LGERYGLKPTDFSATVDHTGVLDGCSAALTFHNPDSNDGLVQMMRALEIGKGQTALKVVHPNHLYYALGKALEKAPQAPKFAAR
jgi:hypothetical protein